MTAEQLEELLGKVTQGEWRVVEGSESSHCCFDYTVTSDQAKGCGSIAETLICNTDADATLIALSPSLARRVIAAERLVGVCDEILDRGYISSSIEEERPDHDSLVSALTAYREASK